jgi:hypothetical protein
VTLRGDYFDYKRISGGTDYGKLLHRRM